MRLNIAMTQLSQARSSTLPRKPISPEELASCQQQRHDLAARCRIVFDRLRPSLIDTHYNWYIAIDPDTQEYIIDPTFDGITKKVVETYGYSHEPKLTMFWLNDTGFCGRI
ncbi:hypothetical protein [Calothrix sp. UHCC 0171]|uniref:hypothetical protein n=1 Tax=Calothrix sp. UHCC 0171 TaxID=3110245 RepID=UPI002B1ED3DD|nr:hypothetical protein [Calothrix sp. UHCC 0171]MEA5574495.1 hypothetical protein [Calothrix sp. UHCC 0171]